MTIAELQEKLEEAQLHLARMGALEFPEGMDPLSKRAHILNVEDQAERSAIRERIFDLKALILMKKGRDLEAAKMGKLATECSTQSTRALKQIQSDRLFELEQEMQNRRERKGTLRAIK